MTVVCACPLLCYYHATEISCSILLKYGFQVKFYIRITHSVSENNQSYEKFYNKVTFYRAMLAQSAVMRQ